MSERPRVTHPYLYGKGWVLWKVMDIPDASDPEFVYLRRLVIVKTPWAALYLHRIYSTDGDRHLHNHPFGFLSAVLGGGYVEARLGKRDRRRRRFSIARMGRSDFHSIRLLQAVPTTTLVLCGPNSKEWGFMVDGAYVPQAEYRESAGLV